MTYLLERVDVGDYDRLWAEALKKEDGTYSERICSDEVEQAFWKTYIQKKQAYKQDETAKVVMSHVKRIIDDYTLESILEVGPGWGNYTLDLADLCKTLTCLDISQDILDYIQRVSKEKGKYNIQTLFSKLEDADLTQKYDLVFGYNCFYRMTELKNCFEKMNAASNKLCMIGMGMGMMPPYYKEMAKVFSTPLIHGKKDYIHFVNLLYSMGIDANVKIIPLEKELIYDSWEQVLKEETPRLEKREYLLDKHQEEIRDILQRYFIEKEDGKIYGKLEFRGALVYWEPKALDSI